MGQRPHVKSDRQLVPPCVKTDSMQTFFEAFEPETCAVIVL